MTRKRLTGRNILTKRTSSSKAAGLFCTLHYDNLSFTILCYTMGMNFITDFALYCTVLYCTVLYCTVLYCTVLYCTVLYCPVLYCTVLSCTVLYCTVLHFIVFSYPLSPSDALFNFTNSSTILSTYPSLPSFLPSFIHSFPFFPITFYSSFTTFFFFNVCALLHNLLQILRHSNSE